MKNNKKTVTIVILCSVILIVAVVGCIMILTRDKQEERQEKSNQVSITPSPSKEGTQENADLTPSQGVEFEDAADTIYIAVSDTRIWKEPSMNSDEIMKPPLGRMYRRTGISQEWSRIEVEEELEECYVHNDDISDTPPDALALEEEMLDEEPDMLPESNTSLNTQEGNGKIVVIDPGHQAKGDNGQEPIGPGASATKARVSSGTTGVASGWAEYELNLAVSLKLKEELLSRGYTVYMTRETHDVSISNKERAEFAQARAADVLIRIHANGSDDSSISGALCMAPSSANTFLSPNLIADSQRLSKNIIEAYVAATGFHDQGVYITDEMSGINWSTIPVTIVEMGYMTNSAEDLNMKKVEVQDQIVQGIAQGIDLYFE